MFAARCPLPICRVPLTYKRRKVSKVCKSYYTIDENNTKLLHESDSSELLHIITFQIPNEEEGVYALSKLNSEGLHENCIVAWRNFDDVFRYKTLLDAEMKRSSYIQFVSHYELNFMCEHGNYSGRVVDDGSLVAPTTETTKPTAWERRSALRNGSWAAREKAN